MTTHSPGPWHIHKGTLNTEQEGAFCDIEGAPCVVGLGLSIATVWADVEELAENADANARLIAAAPDLLAALKELLDAGQFCVDADDDVAAMLRFGKATDAARAAIAKAEGQP